MAGRARLAGIAALAAALSLTLGGCGGGERSEAPPDSEAAPSSGLEISSLRVEGVTGTGERIRIETAGIVMRSRRLGFFSFAPLKEAVLSRTRVEVGLPAQDAAAAGSDVLPALPVSKKLFDLPALGMAGGMLTRLDAEPFELEISDAGGPLLRLAARRARVTSGRHPLELQDLELTSRAEQRLAARRARLLDGARILVARDYRLTEEGGTRSGAESGWRLTRAGRLEPLPDEDRARQAAGLRLTGPRAAANGAAP